MATINRWDIVGNAIVIRNIRLADGREVDAIIEKPDVQVPDGFRFVSDNLLELRDKCASVAGQLANPFQFAVVFAEGESCYAQSLTNRAERIDYSPQSQMVADCQRISALIGSHCTAITSSSALTFVPPTSIQREPPAAPSAPSMRADELIRILNKVPYPDTRDNFEKVRSDLTPQQKADFQRFIVSKDAVARKMREWLVQLAQAVSEHYFKNVAMPQDLRVRRSLEFVIHLLLKGHRANDTQLAEAIAADVLASQQSFLRRGLQKVGQLFGALGSVPKSVAV